MALLATQDQFVQDVHGIRRLVKGGQPVPAGLFNLDDVETTEVPTRTLAQPVIDADASKPSGTALEPDSGISFDHANAAQADAREQGEKTSTRRGKQKPSEG